MTWIQRQLHCYMVDENELPLRHILAIIDEKTKDLIHLNGRVGKHLQDFKFSRLNTTALLYVTWKVTSDTGTLATRRDLYNIQKVERVGIFEISATRKT